MIQNTEIHLVKTSSLDGFCFSNVLVMTESSIIEGIMTTKFFRFCLIIGFIVKLDIFKSSRAGNGFSPN